MGKAVSCYIRPSLMQLVFLKNKMLTKLLHWAKPNATYVPGIEFELNTANSILF